MLRADDSAARHRFVAAEVPLAADPQPASPLGYSDGRPSGIIASPDRWLEPRQDRLEVTWN
ncbi:MAG: hypothetical protein HIU85_05665 [Proteobacteria bacterium]|nr:hypothetical protein [Pseudomonadota bacterium]